MEFFFNLADSCSQCRIRARAAAFLFSDQVAHAVAQRWKHGDSDAADECQLPAVRAVPVGEQPSRTQQRVTRVRSFQGACGPFNVKSVATVHDAPTRPQHHMPLDVFKKSMHEFFRVYKCAHGIDHSVKSDKRP